MSIVLFLLVLFVLVLVHEWGHFIVAKKNRHARRRVCDRLSAKTLSYQKR